MNQLEIKLEALQAEQINQIVLLDELCLGGIWSLEAYQRELENQCSTFLVISLGSQIIGYGGFWAILEEAHIIIIGIHPDYQNKGLGQLLIYALLKEAQKKNLTRATLEVREKNEVALYIYKKFGFKVAGKRKGYYQKTGEDAVILWRSQIDSPKFSQELKEWEKQISNRLRENGLQVVKIP